MTMMNHQLGRLLEGRYRLDALLGIGSSASVYLAHDTRLDRRVAAKVLHPGLAADAAFVRRFSSEARAVALLNHPHIVHVYDWGEESDGPFLILEYLAGGSLKDLLGTWGKISISQATAIGIDAANALAFAYRQGVIHRDVKPANLLFDEHGSVHVADFGLARTLASVTWTEPNGVMLGTARYASPEQALGQPLDGGSDVYSLAIVLYEAVVGRAPFAGETAFATLMNRVGKSLPSAPEAGPLMPLLEAATRAEPENRASAADLENALEQLSTKLPPAQPLSLVPTIASPENLQLRVDDDEEMTTTVGIRNDVDRTLSYGASTAATNAEAARVLGVDPDNDDEPRLHRSRSRHGWVSRYRWLLGGAAFLLVVFAVGAVVITRYGVFEHSVPRLIGLQLSNAQQATKKNELRVRVAAESFSNSIPAGEVITQSPRSGQRERSGTLIDVVVSEGPAPVALPKVVGKTKVSAVKTLDRMHFVPTLTSAYSETVPIGRVVAISPRSGTIPYGSKVSVLASLGPHPRTIPQLPAETYSAASAQLSALRLVPVEQRVYSNDVQRGVIISTTPAEGTTGVAVGSSVVVTVSKGPQLVAVPTVAGETISQAIAALQQVGLVVNEQIGPPFATTATTTDPAPGTRLKVGSSVTLYVA